MYIGVKYRDDLHNIEGIQMNHSSVTTDAADTNRSLSAFGVALIVLSIVIGWWLAAIVGDLVTALWMVLFVVVGVIFISLGRHPDAEA